jgi:hypothetical protein
MIKTGNLINILQKNNNVNNIIRIECICGNNVFLIKFIDYKYKGGDSLWIHDEGNLIETILYNSKLKKIIDDKDSFVKNIIKLIDKILYIKNVSKLDELHYNLKNHDIHILFNLTDITNNNFLIKFKKINFFDIKVLKVELCGDTIKLILWDATKNCSCYNKNIWNYNYKKINSFDDIIKEIYQLANIYLG